jgi:hypothetical protein
MIKVFRSVPATAKSISAGLFRDRPPTLSLPGIDLKPSEASYNLLA